MEFIEKTEFQYSTTHRLVADKEKQQRRKRTFKRKNQTDKSDFV